MHVYVLEAPHGCKIGRSISPDKRVRSIETLGGFSASRIWMTLPGPDAISIERECHKLLSACRLTGEWFDVEFDAAVDVIAKTTQSFIKKSYSSAQQHNNPSLVFAENLSAAMKSRRLSARALAKQIGISDRIIGMYLNKDSVATIENVHRIASAFGFSGWQFLIPNFWQSKDLH